MIQLMSAIVQARQKGFGREKVGTFATNSTAERENPIPTSARQVLGPTPGVREAEQKADRHRAGAKR